MEDALAKGKKPVWEERAHDQTDWHTAEKVRGRKSLRSHLCDLGFGNWRNCVTCESQCAYGRRVIEKIEKGEIRDWTENGWQPRSFERTEAAKRQKERALLEEQEALREDAGRECARILSIAGECAFGWMERLMEAEARRQREKSGQPAWPGNMEDVDEAAVSAWLRAQGVHQYGEMG